MIADSNCCDEVGLDTVTVLLSTYNGAKFLRQQLDSLFEQSYENIKILVRDDGSSDATFKILKAEELAGRIDVLEQNNNLGPAFSFFELLRQAALTKTGFVAFCDQDDYWKPEKIERAISILSGFENKPAMYCSRVELVNDGLSHIKFGDVPKKLGFGNALVENVATGCTIVLNRNAIDLLCERFPSNPQMHDWWCYLVLSCFGVVVFDPVSSIMYRQHESNTVGVAATNLSRYVRKFQRFFGRAKKPAWCSDHALSFLEIFNSRIPQPEKKIIDRFVAGKSSFWYRLTFVFSRKIWRQHPVDDFILRVLLLINKI